MGSSISSSSAFSSTSPSLARTSLLVYLPTRPSTSSPQPLITRLGQSSNTVLVDHFSPLLSPDSLDEDDEHKFASLFPRRLLFPDLVVRVRKASPNIRALPVTAVESYQKGGETTTLVPHRYCIVTVQHPLGGSTYLRLELQVAAGNPNAILIVKLEDDRSALVHPEDRRLAALELPIPPEHAGQATRGPSLDALAELLDIIDKRTGRYEFCSRNCLWLADLVVFACAMKFRKVWINEGRIPPHSPIRKYLDGEIDVLAASAQYLLPDGAPGWMASVHSALVRMFCAFNMQREVEEVVGKWREYMEAVPVPF